MIREYIFQIETFTRLIPQTTLEIGALNAEYSQLLAKQFHIRAENQYLVEPNPYWCTELRQTLPGSQILECAINAEGGSVGLNRVIDAGQANEGCSSLRERIDGWQRHLTYERIEVRSMTGAELLKFIGKPVDMCIIDVEGMTFDVLESFGAAIDRIGSFMLESEHDEVFRGQKQYEQISDLLIKNSFKQMAFRYSYADQSDSVWVREDLLDLHFREGRNPARQSQEQSMES